MTDRHFCLADDCWCEDNGMDSEPVVPKTIAANCVHCGYVDCKCGTMFLPMDKYAPPIKPPKFPTDDELAEKLRKLTGKMIEATGDEDIDELFRGCVDILGKKGQDYTVGQNDTDRLYNFREGALKAGVTPRQVWFVYFWKHLTAIERYVKEGRVDSEGIKGRIQDGINYLALLYKIVCETERGNI